MISFRTHTKRFVLLVAVMLTGTTAALGGQIVYVDASAPAGGDGQSWATAFRYLQDALTAAGTAVDVEFRVAQGTYRPDQGAGKTLLNVNELFALPDGAKLLGGFAGRSTSTPDARDSNKYPTILSGELPQENVSAYYHNSGNSAVIVSMAGNQPVLIEGLTVTGAQAVAVSGGINVTIRDCELRRSATAILTGGNLSLFNCIIRENYGDSDSTLAGILWGRKANIILTGCRIEDNNARNASAVYCEGGTLSLTDCVFRRNRSDNGTALIQNAAVQVSGCVFTQNMGQYRSALTITYSTGVSVRNTRFEQNSAIAQGGGLQFGSVGQAEVSDCRFEGNLAGGGAAAFSTNSTANFVRCSFLNNQAHYIVETYRPGGGGAILCKGGSTTVRACDFTGNTTIYSGGAMLCQDATVQLLACRFLQNHAEQSGGALNLDAGTTSLVNCVVARNSASAGSAISIGTDSSVGPQTTIANCLFTANDLGSSPIIDDSTAGPSVYNSILWNGPQPFRNVAVVSHCCIQDDTPGDGQVYPGEGNIDTFTGFAIDGDYHLNSSSPCIDAGIAVPQILPEFDLDGQSRSIDGDSNGSIVPDIGPYEYNPSVATLSTVEELELVIPYGSEASRTEQLQIASSGTAADWTVTGAEPWLDVSPNTGVCNANTVSNTTLTFNFTQLQRGTYASDLIISSAQAVNSPRKVRVIVHLTAPYHVPWTHPTIQAAMDAAPAGATVVVADGMYSGAGGAFLNNRGKPLTIVSEHGPDRTIIDCTSYAAFVPQAGSSIVVDGFAISNFYSVPAITCQTSNSVIRNCVFAQPPPRDYFHLPAPAISVQSCSPEISGCRFSGLFRGAIQCSRSSPLISGCDISDNLCDVPYKCNEPAIACYDASHPTITNCTLIGNQAGAIYSTGSSSINVSNCTISGNYSTRAGGAIALEAGPASTIVDCVLNGNRGPEGGAVFSKAPITLANCELNENYGTSGTYAGAIKVTGATLIVENCTLDSNRNNVAIRSDTSVAIRHSYLAHHTWGAVYSTSGLVELTDTTFEANGTNTLLSGAVGALWVNAGNATINRCLFRSNLASNNGAAVYVFSGSNELAITDSRFIANTAIRGSAVYCTCGKFSAVNNLFVGNSAALDYGAAYISTSVDAAVLNCAFVENRSKTSVGGMYLTGSNYRVMNSIFWGNQAAANKNGLLTGSGTNRTISRCVVEGGITGMVLSRGTPPTSSYITETDPLFVRPGHWDDKGTVDLSDDTWTEGDYRLTFNSPCIDAGDSTALPAGVSADLAGLPRFMDELSHADTGVPTDGRAVVDLGPYEYAASVVGRYVFYNDSIFDGSTSGADPADDAAIATDKTALLPGQKATTSNYISYSRGINGIMLDVSAMAADPVAADFEVSLRGPSDTQWRSGPSPTSVTVRHQAGAGGSDRVTLIWPDQAVPNTQWLRIRAKSNVSGGRLGLATDDVFCFGLAMGETGTLRRDLATVDATDAIGIRNHKSTTGQAEPITSVFDVNRDGRVDADDEQVAQIRGTTIFRALKMLELPAEVQ